MEEYAGDQEGFGPCMEAQLEYLVCRFENGECETYEDYGYSYIELRTEICDEVLIDAIALCRSTDF